MAKQTADDLANRLEDTLAIVKHAMGRDAVRRAANNYTSYAPAAESKDTYSDRYMKNIGKGKIALQQEDMKDTADSEMDKQRDKDQKKAKPSSFKKGGVVLKTGMAKVHKGEKVLTVKQQKEGKKVKANWIQGAVKHKGSLTAAAEKKGKSVLAEAKEESHSPNIKIAARGRLALRFKGKAKHGNIKKKTISKRS